MEHHVYFWLKEERKNDADRAAFENGIRELAKSANVGEGTWGKPAPTAERPVTDHSWDYGLSFKFASMDAHNAYQGDDPHHDTFVASFKDWWERVLVLDLETD